MLSIWQSVQGSGGGSVKRRRAVGPPKAGCKRQTSDIPQQPILQLLWCSWVLTLSHWPSFSWWPASAGIMLIYKVLDVSHCVSPSSCSGFPCDQRDCANFDEKTNGYNISIQICKHKISWFKQLHYHDFFITAMMSDFYFRESKTRSKIFPHPMYFLLSKSGYVTSIILFLWKYDH